MIINQFPLLGPWCMWSRFYYSCRDIWSSQCVQYKAQTITFMLIFQAYIFLWRENKFFFSSVYFLKH